MHVGPPSQIVLVLVCLSGWVVVLVDMQVGGCVCGWAILFAKPADGGSGVHGGWFILHGFFM